MLAWNDLVENEASTKELQVWRAPFKRYGPVYPFEGAEKLEIPDIAYTGNAHCSDYHGKMNGTPLRVRFWFSSSFDEQLQETFHARLKGKLRDWNRAASGHTNISPFYGLAESPGWGKVPSLVMPLYGMNINEYLRHTTKTNPLLLKVADALAYMHSLNPPVVHGAIRGRVPKENIHIDEQGEPKLVDTGLEHLPRAYGASEDQHDRDRLRWLAPEVIDPPYECDDQDQDSYDSSTPETDVWSFGMTMLEVKHLHVHHVP
ncbi:hypothetical protein C0992_004425 [Termitomyces sp. T32_za158]|nr:hypothetical protein C0992_004425 [Termitomyces sp. T32_za158]